MYIKRTSITLGIYSWPRESLVTGHLIASNGKLSTQRKRIYGGQKEKQFSEQM